MADPVRPIIIIRRKKKGGHPAHHGGAWKVAYADFVTAMMAFFLLLWLLNVTTDIERKGIADYFAPAAVSKSESGSGGIGGGVTITSEGAAISAGSPPTVQDVTLPTVGKGEQGDEETAGQSQGEGAGKATQGPDAMHPNGQTGVNGSATNLTKDEQNMIEVMKNEEKGFDQAEDILKQAITGNPELREFANQIVVDRTPEGLRIQIIDRDKFSMFPSGSAIPYERARDLMMLVGKVIAQLPNSVSVTGHTDSTPFSPGSGRDNWTLSAERANVSRELLMKAGVAEERIARVSGLAGRDPFIPNDPKDSRNRRISIILLRKSIPPAPTTEPPPAPVSIPTQAK